MSLQRSSDPNGPIASSGEDNDQPTHTVREKRRYTVTPKVIDAHRASAKKSTGPRSVAGKQISRRNSLTHALTAFQVGVAVPEEEVSAYRKLEKAMLRRYEPLDPIGEWTVRQLIEAFWRSRRIDLTEAALIPPADVFLVQDAQAELIFRYTAMNDRRILMLRQLIAEHCRTAV
jgi:hypothetical protein